MYYCYCIEEGGETMQRVQSEEVEDESLVNAVH